jgi:hypothetical protein
VRASIILTDATTILSINGGTPFCDTLWTMNGRTRPPATLLALFALICFGSGCTRTYISTGDPGVPSPDGSSTRICWTTYGAYGRSFVQRTKKLVDVCIKKGQQPQAQTLFLHRYKFIASDLGGDARWVSPEEVVLQFYDYGDGVTSYDASKTGAPSNHISTLAFHLDKHSGRFTEKK